MSENKQQELVTQPIDNVVAAIESSPPVPVGSMYHDSEAFSHIQRVAKVFNQAHMSPEVFQKNLASCIVAIELANTLRIHPFILMQGLYVVHGKPALDGKLVIALIKTRAGFTKFWFTYDGTEGSDNRRCTAHGIRNDGSACEKSFTIKEAKDWGWYGKSGSAWPKMPDQMLAYRAAAFFARIHCPEVTLGMQTIEEINDTIEVEAVKSVEEKIEMKRQSRE